MSIRQPLYVVKQITNTETSGTTNYDFMLPQDCDSVSVRAYTGTFTGTSPTIDIYVQTTPDGGSTWYDMVHMTQITAAVSKSLAQWARLGVSTQGTTTSTSGCSTLGSGLVSPLPILSQFMRIAVKLGGTQVVNAGTVIEVFANSQSARP
jgi:hypothetical protein